MEVIQEAMDKLCLPYCSSPPETPDTYSDNLFWVDSPFSTNELHFTLINLPPTRFEIDYLLKALPPPAFLVCLFKILNDFFHCSVLMISFLDSSNS